MKKRLMVILSLALAVCCCLGLAACGLFGFGADGGGSSSGSGSGSGGGSSQPQVDSDGTFLYSGSTVKAASTSISGAITIPAEHNGMPIDTIPANAFNGCNAITSITVPESVTSIGAGAFNGCSSLRSITLPFIGSQKGNTGSAAYFGYIFGTSSYQGGTGVEHEKASWPTRYYIPETLRSVTITNETIIGKYAFRNCTMLTEINLNEKVIQVGERSFEYCSKLEEINLPSVSILPEALFGGCISLSKFTINDSVDSIGEEVFRSCHALSSINSETAGTFIIPDTITSIGAAAFNGCSLVKDITLPFVGYQKGNTGSAAYFGYIFGTSSYQGGTGVEHEKASWPTRYYIPETLRSVTITNETIIGKYAFRNCSMLQSITINKAAQNSVGEKAFENTATPTWN